MVLAALALVAPSTGCDPGWGIAGRVIEHPRATEVSEASGTVAAAGRPLAGAKLELACASRRTLSFVTTSGPDGAFQLGALGVLPADCTLAASAPGFRARSYRLAEYCTGRFRGACSEMPPSGATHPGLQPNPLLDNYEALALGPTLPDGRRVVFVTSDDNASASQLARVLVLAIPGLGG